MLLLVLVLSPAITASPNPLPKVDFVSGGTYQEFIDALWAYESSIDRKDQAKYNQYWNTPIVDAYPLVIFPGRVVRDWRSGEPVQAHNLTFKEYFTAIGVADLYDPSDPNPPWKDIQAAVVNYLGFVGFQFQESDLNDLGYYKFARKQIGPTPYPSHYVDVPVSNWAYGVTGFLDADPSEVSEPTWVTDTVTFLDEGFTGKNGIYSYADFINPDLQIYIIQDHFVNKYDGIKEGLAAVGKTIADYLGTTLYWNGLKPPVSPPPGGRSNAVTVTMSGLLAGAHLRGAEGVIELLVDHENPADESGTYILQYVQDYGGYDTPFPPEH